MNWSTLHRRSFPFHRRANFAVLLGVLAGTAALTGALLVGDSMRASLRRAALERLGRVEYALSATHFFDEKLADAWKDGRDDSSGFRARSGQPVPTLLLNGFATHADTRTRANRVGVFGVTPAFWRIADDPPDAAYQPPADFTGRSVLLNEALADQLHAKAGDEILLGLGKPGAVASETLLGRRDETTAVLRLTVRGIIPSARKIGVFSLNPGQRQPCNAYVPLPILQRLLDQPNRVNSLLIARAPEIPLSQTTDPNAGAAVETLSKQFQERISPADIGLRLRVDETRGYVALESDSMLLDPPVEAAALAAADALGAPAARLMIYLANEIHVEEGPRAASAAASQPAAPRAIPYSTVAAIDESLLAQAPFLLLNGSPAPALQPGEILLNEWAADDLQVQTGNALTLAYYVTEAFGRLTTKQHTFRLRGVVRLAGPAADPGFTPVYRGVTDSQSIADWDPPFPMDLKKVRPKDEDYWKKHRATPKAFVSLQDGQTLWAEHGERFGRLTAIRLGPAKNMTLAETAAAWRREILKKINLSALGFRFEPVRRQALAASAGNTDFGGLFIGFSFFLIISAALLVALLFRLGIERRAAEIGLLLAVGATPRRVLRFLLMEGFLIAGLGAALGLLAALGYAWLMLAGLRSWWSAAVNAPFLQLHGSWQSFAIGYVAGVGVAMLSIAWALRGLTRLPCRALLAGVVSAQTQEIRPRRRRVARGLAIVLFIIAFLMVALATFTRQIPSTIAFWCGGAAALAACLAAMLDWLKQEHRGVIRAPGFTSWLRLGARNAVRQPLRSILTIGLVASAAFVISSMQAFRLEAENDTSKQSGAGGFSLLAEAASPLPYDLNAPDGRANLNVPPDAEALLKEARIAAFRLRPGDETSCLNLYRADQPRVLGATPQFIQRGGFRFAATLARTPEERQNPWLLLQRRFDDGAVAVIGDESAVKWQLHRDAGADFVITDERGRETKLRFVALLQGSALQSELIVAEENFTRLFPSINGHAFFLIETPARDTAAVEQVLERELSAFGLDVSATRDRLNDYFAVQNTYLSTFQTLGGLGLVLGMVGLAAILLRGVWERRRELALLQTVGFSRAAVGWIVLGENAALALTGLLIGMASALLAIAPAVAARPATIPWLSLGALLAAVFGVGLLAGVWAVRAALRLPPLAALRAE